MSSIFVDFFPHGDITYVNIMLLLRIDNTVIIFKPSHLPVTKSLHIILIYRSSLIVIAVFSCIKKNYNRITFTESNMLLSG